MNCTKLKGQVIILNELKGLRRAAGLTQMELSKRSGVPQATISYVERHDYIRGPHKITAIKLAVALGFALGIDPDDMREAFYSGATGSGVDHAAA